ncbi:MAG: hypothetical protein RL596_794 [Bacteroidota bacterium]
MNEQLLHFIWQHRYFSNTNLQTTNGLPLQIIRTGLLNVNQGPDFSAASIIIDNIKMIGNIELHKKASDWYQHKHQYDPLYQPIILHVVWEPDRDVIAANGMVIPCLHLAPFVSKIMLRNFSQMMLKRKGFACEKLLGKLNPLIWESWQERLAVERLSRKAVELKQKLDVLKGDWNMLALSLFAHSMGGRVNGVAFETAMNTLSFQQIIRLSKDPDQLNAWLLGLLALLPPNAKDSYPNALISTYDFLQKKYRIGYAVPQAVFLRMRPAGFPTLRVAQLVNWIYHHSAVFNELTRPSNREICNEILTMQAAAYWDTHFCFDQLAPSLVKQVGQAKKDTLVINVIVPLIFTYGLVYNKTDWQERAIAILLEVAPEENITVRQWQKAGAPQKNAMQTQALLELEKNYCSVKKCLHCAIGNAILKS